MRSSIRSTAPESNAMSTIKHWFYNAQAHDDLGNNLLARPAVSTGPVEETPPALAPPGTPEGSPCGASAVAQQTDQMAVVAWFVRWPLAIRVLVPLLVVVVLGVAVIAATASGSSGLTASSTCEDWDAASSTAALAFANDNGVNAPAVSTYCDSVAILGEPDNLGSAVQYGQETVQEGG